MQLKTEAQRRKSLKLLKALLSGKSVRATHVSELAQQLVSVFGGPSKFAVEFLNTYQTADSPHAKARMLGDVMKLVTLDTQISGKTTSVDDIALEDMQTELRQLVEGSPSVEDDDDSS